MKRVYVAGPIGANDEGRSVRVRAAIDAGEKIRRAGMFPFIPHIAEEWSKIHEHTYECWMRYDDAWLVVSEAVFRVPGHSPGADREVARAAELGIPVFHDFDSLVAWGRGGV